METERIIDTNRSAISANIVAFRSVGGKLAKQLGLSEYSSSEICLSKIQPDTTRSYQQSKKDFLPFLNERDRMNRLLTVFFPYNLE